MATCGVLNPTLKQVYYLQVFVGVLVWIDGKIFVLVTADMALDVGWRMSVRTGHDCTWIVDDKTNQRIRMGAFAD